MIFTSTRRSTYNQRINQLNSRNRNEITLFNESGDALGEKMNACATTRVLCLRIVSDICKPHFFLDTIIMRDGDCRKKHCFVKEKAKFVYGKAWPSL